ncbi:conserved hypothetical protein [Trichinella spiralis]|uniref:hypothetical protein n=1 Tax=Trichinella spiralis TaxID=6334 RepID=UPI0001EFDCE3|nr:conserved hypothetical protein [Trichinella spiralis]
MVSNYDAIIENFIMKITFVIRYASSANENNIVLRLIVIFVVHCESKVQAVNPFQSWLSITQKHELTIEAKALVIDEVLKECCVSSVSCLEPEEANDSSAAGVGALIQIFDPENWPLVTYIHFFSFPQDQRFC